MTPKHAFGVAVRVVGLVVLLAAVLYFISGVILLISPKYRPDVSPAWHYFLSGVIELITGLYLLRGAPFLVRFAYPGENISTSINPEV